MNIYSEFEKAARTNGDRLALVHGEQEYTYTELENDILGMEDKFRANGLVAGDRVLVFVPVGFQLYVAVLALFRMGAVAVFIDEWATRDRVKHCLAVAPCKAMVCSWLSGLLSYRVHALRQIEQKIWVGYAADRTEEPVYEAADSQEALVTFTTGSTGIPKAANRSHGFLRAQLRALEPYLSKDKEARNWCTLPVVTLLNLAMGKTTVLPDIAMKQGRLKPLKLKRSLEKHGVSEMITSPFYVSQLCRTSWPEKLKLVQTGGGAVFAEDAAQWIAAAPNTEFTIFYGSTECEPVSHVQANEILANAAAQRGLPVGEIAKETALRIIPFMDAGYQMVTESEFGKWDRESESGEIIVAGEHVLQLYIGLKEEELSNKIRVGNTLWHRTGDAGYRIGRELFLLGRCAERMVQDNTEIFPFEVEGWIRSITGKTSGTMIEVNGALQLVLVSSAVKKQREILEGIKQKWNVTPALRLVENLPMDPRHHTKMDYAAIRQKLVLGKEKVLTIPNLLSAYRLLSFPVIAWFILQKQENLVGVLICINLVTDILDGLIARLFHMQTRLGARLDSMADIGTYALVFWSLLVFKKAELGADMTGVWIFLGFYLGTHVFSLIRFGIFPSLHLYSVKITGYLQGIYFFLLFSYGHISWWFWIAIGWGLLAWTEEFLVLGVLKEMRSNAKSIFHVLKENKSHG